MSQPSTFGSPTTGTHSGLAVSTFINASLLALLSAHAGAARPAYAVAGTIWRNSTTGQYFEYDGTTDNPLARMVTAPATATDPGNPGDWASDGSYLYICTATDTWVRVAVATW